MANPVLLGKARAVRSICVSFWTALSICLAILFVPGNLSADTIAVFVGGTASANFVAGEVIASDMSAGSALTGFTPDATGGNPGLAFEAVDWTANTAPDPDSALVFTLQSNTSDLTFTKINVDVRPQGSGPQEFAILYQISGSSSAVLFGTALETPAKSAVDPDPFTNWAELQFTGNLTLAPGSTVTFYLAGYDAKNSGKSMQVDNVVVIGSVPEPQVISLVALFLLTLLLFRRPRPQRGSIAPVL